MYIIRNSIDDQEYGSFPTKKEAQERVRELRRFDKEQGNPFDEGYFIIKEDDDEIKRIIRRV